MKKLYRSKHNKVLGGVSAGLAEYISMDPVVVRLILIFLFTVTGFVPVVVLYICALVLVPVAPDSHDTSRV